MAKRPPTPKPPKGKNIFHEELLGDDTWGTVDVSKLPKPKKG